MAGLKSATDALLRSERLSGGGLGSREPEGPGLLARLWMKEEPSRPFPFAPEGRQKGGGGSPGRGPHAQGLRRETAAWHATAQSLETAKIKAEKEIAPKPRPTQTKWGGRVVVLAFPC